MTSVFKRVLILAITFTMLISCFAACDESLGEVQGSNTETSTPEEENVVYTLNLSADKSVATRGESVTLTATLKAEGQEDIPSEDTEFIIVNGSEYASVSGNVLKISENAPDGATITVQAKEGASYSNTVAIKVSVPLKSIVISAATEKPAAGQSVVITKVVDPSDATQTIDWEITEGAEFVTMTGDVLMVSESAAVGTVIKLKAVSGDVQSNEITLTVRSSVEEIPAESVTITAATSTLLAGESVIISGNVKPANSTDSIRYEIVEGEDFATLSANVLIISKNATAGVVIKVVAYAGEVKSNELAFTVSDNTVAAESVEIYANNLTPLAGQSVAISKQINPQNTTDKAELKIIEGADKAEMVGDVLIIKDTAAEGDVIKVQAFVGEVESNVLEFVVSTTEIKAQKVTISSDVDAVLAGQSAIIKSFIEPANSTEDIIIYITEGAEYATISGNVLVVGANAPANAVIKVVAKAGSVNSNELTFTVTDTNVSAENISISADDLNPIAGHTVTVNYVVTPANYTDKLTWEIVEGKDIATMAGNILVVSANAEKDAKITIKAVAGNVESNVLTFTVRPATEEIKAESIQISANTEVLRGQAVVINKIINPQNTNEQLLWQFVEGSNYATINGDTIIISSDAKTGTKITVKVVSASGVESNTLTFTVQPSQEEINASKFYIDLSKDSFTLDKKGTAASPILVAEVYNYNYEKVTDKELEFKVISGAQYLGITASGANCSFTDLKGHGTAIVEVRIKGTDIVETAEINVIVPPDAVILPEVFLERTDIEYSFSMIDHIISYVGDPYVKDVTPRITDNGAASLPFVPSVRGNGACQEIKLTFTHESGKTGDEVAVYENGAITFKMPGKVTVTVSSASGSKVEATTTYKFNINEGFNVNSFAELQLLVRSSAYTGKVPANIVVLEKPQSTTCTKSGCYCGGKTFTHGYDLVPPVGLEDHKDQTIHEILYGHDGHMENTTDGKVCVHDHNGLTSNRVQAVNKSLYLNGNSHTIDVSSIRIFSEAEFNGAKTTFGTTGNPSIGSLLSAEPWYSGGENAGSGYDKQSYEVKLYNVETKGNAPIDYDPTMWREDVTSMRVGIFETGINVGVTAYDCHYYIDADNITSSGFGNGLSFTGIVGNGKVRNVTAYNCYVNGILSRGNIMTLENVTFGRCGATGIELAPEESAESGILDNENQQVTISGVINAKENVNAGNTTYYQNYQINGADVPAIINGNATGIVEAAKTADPYGQGEAAGNNAVAHIRNAKGEFIFVSLKFVDLKSFKPNPSTVIYPNYQEGGIITVEQLLTDILTKSDRDSSGAITKMYVDTTHQFIEMPIQAPGLGTVGTALFYNHNYGK